MRQGNEFIAFKIGSFPAPYVLAGLLACFLIGGLGIGSLIGGGSGRDVAMVAGTLGGALVGNEIQKRHDEPEAGQQIIVRVKSGVLVQVTQPANTNLRQGQRVLIDGSGEGARVVPQQ